MIKPCPSKPNCVSSMEMDPRYFIKPMRFKGAVRDAQYIVLEILFSLKRTRIVEYDDYYIHAECASAIFGFTDDLEFIFNDIEKLIHIKSASRVGYSDLGVNRRRVEKIREIFRKMNFKEAHK